MRPKEPLPMLHSLHSFECENGAVLYWMDTDELENEIYFSEYYKMMSHERRRKIDSCLFNKDKRLSLGAGILMDRGLSAYGLCEREVMVSYGKNGKPYLPRHPHIHFNLSHSGSRALAVFAAVETGCDIEQMEQADLALAERFFTRKEYAFISGKQGSERQEEAFYRLWTLKESFLKAVGAGLALSLDAFEITISPKGKVAVRGKSDEAGTLCSGKFEFREYRLGKYYTAVCFWKDKERGKECKL